MKKVLLVCNHFAPDNTIAAIRTTKFAKYLGKAGYKLTVIAEEKNNDIYDSILSKDAEGIKVYRISNSRKALIKIETYERLISNIKKRRFDDLEHRMKKNPISGNVEFYPFQTAYPVIGSFDYLFELYRQHDLYFNARKLLTNIGDFDYLITSYGDMFSVFFGEYFKKIHGDVKWVADIRDAVYRYKFTPIYVRPVTLAIEKNIWKEADEITCVSKGICRRVSKTYRSKVHYIPNGFDMSDRDGILPTDKNDGLKIVYTGSMYGGMQNLQPIFKCVKELIDNGSITYEKIIFQYAGNISAYKIFRSQAEKYGIGSLCMYEGRLERKDALQLQTNADILLVASYDYKEGYGGVITGKALEYMSAYKPIIAIVGGDVLNNELTAIIRRGRLGCAYEEANKENDYIALKKYLLNAYDEFHRNGYIVFKPDDKVLQKYDYRYLTGKLIKVLQTTGGKRR